MEDTVNTPAIILNRQEYREHDILVTVYTPIRGRLQLVARGAKKLKSKLAGHIEPLTMADIMIIRGRGHDYLGSSLTRKSYYNLRLDLNKLYFAGQVAGIYLRLTEESSDESDLFSLLTEWLDYVNSYSVDKELDKDKGNLLLSAFIFRFLSQIGNRPEMNFCVACRRVITSGGNFFDFSSGGLICEPCFKHLTLLGGVRLGQKVPISDNSIKAIRFIIDSQLPEALRLSGDKKTAKELLNLASRFLDFVRF